MNFYDVIENRTSVRQYKNTPVDAQKVSRMIDAAMMSPSWKNNTSYKFILVTNESERKILSNCIMNDNNDTSMAIRKAPLTAIVVANPEESGIVEGREYYLVDSAIAMEHFMLAATNEGYGTCWIGAINEEKIKRALNIPDQYKVVAITPIGVSDEREVHQPKKRISEHVYLNSWGEGYKENNLH